MLWVPTVLLSRVKDDNWVPLPGRAGKEREDAGGREQITAIAASPRVWMRRFTLCIVLYLEVCVCVRMRVELYMHTHGCGHARRKRDMDWTAIN